MKAGSCERGVAIVSVLLLLLVATALAHGALLVVQAESLGARGHVRWEQARLHTAWAATSWVRSDSSRRHLDTVAVGGWVVWPSGVSAGNPSADDPPPWLRLRRLSPEAWWLEPTDAAHRSRRVGLPGRLLEWMDPGTRVRALGGAVVVGPEAVLVLDGLVDASGFYRVEPPLTPTLCDELVGAADPRATVEGTRVRSQGELLGVGSLPFSEILAATGGADATARTVEVSGSPRTRESGGACLTDDPWNWGDPERPARACGEHVAVRRAPGDVEVMGGTGQAAMVVDGDLVLRGDTRVYGFVLASGSLILHDDAEFQGAAVVGGGLSVAPGARVRGSGCWAARALRAGRAVWMPGPRPVAGVGPIAP